MVPDVGQDPTEGVWIGVAAAVVSVIVPGIQAPPKFGDQVMVIVPFIHSSSLESAFVRILLSRFVSVKVNVKVLPPPLKPNEKLPL